MPALRLCPRKMVLPPASPLHSCDNDNIRYAILYPFEIENVVSVRLFL